MNVTLLPADGINHPNRAMPSLFAGGRFDLAAGPNAGQISYFKGSIPW
jgi:hypothetical protein